MLHSILRLASSDDASRLFRARAVWPVFTRASKRIGVLTLLLRVAVQGSCVTLNYYALYMSFSVSIGNQDRHHFPLGSISRNGIAG